VHRILLEVAVTTGDEAQLAAEAGADRLELCSALEVGGVTPSRAAFFAVREVVAIPVYVLLRPRSGGFVYSGPEFATIQRDAEWFLDHGANGIVFGVLTTEGSIDRIRCAELVAIAKGKAVFHRAFDFLSDRLAALEEIVDLGFERSLTSGGAPTAIEGRVEIAKLVQRAAGRIKVLPAGGIRPDNVAQLLCETGCSQVHASLRSERPDSTLELKPQLKQQMGERRATDAKLVREMRAVLDQARMASG
jgi:copper homeostasis protein CutC